MRYLRTVVTSIVALVASLALAFEFPPDAEFIVTDAQGVIVAIGRSVDASSVSVEVWSAFEGPARLTLFLFNGSTRAVDVAIADRVVTIEGVDLRVLLAEVFEKVAVRFVAEPGASTDPPGLEQGPAGESGADDREVPGRHGEPPAHDRRPEEPPGQERRSEEPPGQDLRPEEPPGQDRKPEEPPGRDRKPEEPSGPDRRPVKTSGAG